MRQLAKAIAREEDEPHGNEGGDIMLLTGRGIRSTARLLPAAFAVAMALATTATPARTAMPGRMRTTIDRVVFGGSAAKPVITVDGDGFGRRPSAHPRTGTSGLGGCGPIRGQTGYDYGDRLWIADRTERWSAGRTRRWVDCIGLIIIRYSSRRIVLGLGSLYRSAHGRRNPLGGIYDLGAGDALDIDVRGALREVRVHYDRSPSWPGNQPGPLVARGRYLIDPQGRVVILHGLFAAWKQPPLYPAGVDDPNHPSTPSFTAGDADIVSGLGFDGVRLAWYWEGLEPAPGRFSSTYLDGLAGAEARFARGGVYVVLDAHQDQYDHLFGNEPGFPPFTAVTDSYPVAPASDDPGYAAWKFPLGYFHPSTELAFGHLYANSTVGGRPIATEFGRAWRVIAARFRHDPMVAGYDLVNEPFPGSTTPNDAVIGSCAQTTGCPDFDRHVLEPFELSLAAAIRRVDRTRPVFLEPTFYFNSGVPAPFDAPPARLAPAGLSFHDQCPTRPRYAVTHDPATIEVGHATCPPASAKVLANASTSSRMLGGPALETEVASTSDADTQGLNCLLEQTERAGIGFTYGLSWSNPNDELRRLSAESSATGAAPFKDLVLARVYPRAVAGVPLSYGFDVRTGVFTLRYRVRRHVRAPTEIAIPLRYQYPRGYVTHVTGARTLSQADASLLLLANRPGSREVAVRVSPAAVGGVERPHFPACPG